MNTMSHRYPTFLHLLRPLVWLVVPGLVAAIVAINAFASDDPELMAIGGEGAGGISGYVVSGIHYRLQETNPGLIRAVTFDVLGGDGQTRPTTVGVTLGPGQPTTACRSTDGDEWTCPVSVPAADASALRVVAAG
jgi:hypothetical protein